MSHETRQSVHQPEISQDEERHVAPRRLGRKKTLAAAVAGLALAGGIGAFGFNGGEEAPKPKPSTSAPANPGEHTPTPTESEPTSKYENLTRDEFPYIVEGEQVSYEELIAANELNVEEFPTAQDALVQLIDNTNKWIATGATEKELAEYSDFVAPNGEATQYPKGLEGAAAYYYDRTFAEALTAPGSNGQKFVDMISEGHKQYLAMWEASKDQIEPFDGEYGVGDKDDMLFTEANDGTLVGLNTMFYWKDTTQQAEPTGQYMYFEMAQTENADGDKVWKLQEFNPSQYPAPTE